MVYLATPATRTPSPLVGMEQGWGWCTGYPAEGLLSGSVSSDSVARRGRRPGDLRVVIRRPAKLPRTLGAPALFAACYGNVGSSIYYALGVTAAFALGLTPLALILAGFIFITTALEGWDVGLRPRKDNTLDVYFMRLLLGRLEPEPAAFIPATDLTAEEEETSE